MAVPSPRMMDGEQFDRVAQSCRWSQRSLAVVRAVLVDGVSIASAAATQDMSEKQARVLRARFLDKAEKHRKQRLTNFMSKEPPKLATTPLDAYASDVRELRKSGYTIAQIVTYFQNNGVATSATTVRKFLRSLPA